LASAVRTSETSRVTRPVSVFLEPVQVGDAVCCYTDPVRIGRTSITLNVEVWVLRQGRGTRLKVTEAEFVFVAVNENGRPCPLA
jgi:acyl-CoA thioesterase YciA